LICDNYTKHKHPKIKERAAEDRQRQRQADHDSVIAAVPVSDRSQKSAPSAALFYAAGAWRMDACPAPDQFDVEQGRHARMRLAFT